MRIKGVFTLFARKLASGKQVYYYHCYDKNGNRQWAKSTGQSKKTEALAYCMMLYKEGQLIPEKKSITFSEFSNGWWNSETCRYLKWRELHEPLTKSTINIHKNNFHRNIKDYFAKYRLNEVTPEIIETWLLELKEKDLKPSTINLQLKTLRMMIGEAFRLKLINFNPCKEVKEVKSEETKRIILTVEEAKKLFPFNWLDVWETRVVCIAHKIGACTGIRISEMLGLKREHIFDNYICVKGQFTAFGYVENTKTKHNRNIPITSLMRAELEELLAVNGNGYVFSENCGETPIGREKIHRQFAKALVKIGISRKEQLERKLSYHSWRHFLNTLLRMSNVADSKVQSVTGHRSMRMTEHYTHFDSRQFTEVVDVQTNFLTLQEHLTNVTEKLNVQEMKKTKNGKKAISVKQKRSKNIPITAIKRKPVTRVKMKNKA